MASAAVTHSKLKPETAVLLAIGVLWAQVFAALIPVWRFGQYYDYGWLVPPIAAGFVFRRHGMGLFTPAAAGGWFERWPRGAVILAAVCLAAFLAALRIVQLANLDWRPPMILHALAVAAGGHVLMLAVCGVRASLALFPVTLFAFSAVPYPGRAETEIISTLTNNVIAAATEMFHLNGYPVEQVGERLALEGQMVEVTEGCSGIRSLQSLLMAGLFFGEFLLLSWRGRLTLVAVAVACAFILNIARAYWLAKTQFFEGAARAEAIHDLAGHLAFAISAIVLFATGALLRRQWGMKTVITRHGGPGPA